MARGRKRKDKGIDAQRSGSPERTPLPRSTQSWMETHGRDLRFLLIFGTLMGAYYVVSTAAVVTDRFFPWYLRATADVSADVMNTFGYDDVTAKGQALNSSKGSIAVERGCDAIAPTALFVSAVLASPAPIASKVLAVFGGIFILMVINVVRIITLFLTAAHWRAAFDIMHLDIWQALFILLAILLWAFWASWTTQRQKRQTDAATAAT